VTARRIRIRGRRGIALVEMVVAVTLLGIGIAAAAACISSATRASGRAEELTAVRLLAREQLADLQTEGVSEGEDQGDFGEDRPNFKWRTVATPGQGGGKQVRLTILWGDEDHPRQQEFVAYARSTPQSQDSTTSVECMSCHPNGIPDSGEGSNGKRGGAGR
jgi:type II secretory pathway pseudopilin PulG